jgi:hypothetical protein
LSFAERSAFADLAMDGGQSMMFSAADIRVQETDSFGDFFEQLGKIEPVANRLSPAKIEALTSKADESAALTHGFLDHILDYDVRWRTAVFRGETDYDPAIEERIETGLRAWLNLTESLLAKLQPIRSWGFQPASLETLRPRIAEVRNMLTPDDEFFEGEELDDLTEKAIAEHEAGRTVEFRVMGE